MEATQFIGRPHPNDSHDPAVTIAVFISQEVGHWNPALIDQARDLIAYLEEYGFEIRPLY